MAVAALFTACDDSNYGWEGSPLSSPEETPQTVTFGDGSVTEVNPIDLATVTMDEVQVARITAPTVTDEGTSTTYEITFNTTPAATYTISADGYMSTEDLSNVVVNAFGKRPSQRILPATITAYVAKGGQVVSVKSSEFNVYVTPKAPHISQNYYIVGAPQGWSLSDKTYKFNHSDADVYDDPIFTIVFPAAADGDTWFAIGDDAAMDAGNWSGILGTTLGNGNNGVNVTEKLDTRANIGNDASFVVPAGHKFIKVTINMMDYTYLIETLDFGTEMYLAGSCNGWSQIDVLKGTGDGHYTGYMYLDQGGFKFCTQQNWDGPNYGEGFSTDGGAGNITMSEAPGYYKVDLDLVGMNYTLTAITTIGVIGDATVGGWDSDQDMTYDQANRCWTIDNIELTGGKTIKFRANDGWDINWGGDASALTQGGANINIAESGTYSIKLYAWADGVAKCEITKK